MVNFWGKGLTANIASLPKQLFISFKSRYHFQLTAAILLRWRHSVYVFSRRKRFCNYFNLLHLNRVEIGLNRGGATGWTGMDIQPTFARGHFSDCCGSGKFTEGRSGKKLGMQEAVCWLAVVTREVSVQGSGRVRDPAATERYFFTARRYASAVYAVVVCLSDCPSVCPSVTSRQCTKTAKRRITQTTW